MPTPQLINQLFSLKLCCAGIEEQLRTRFELSPAEFHALRATPGDGWSCVRLADSLSLSASRTTRVVDALVDRGLCSREQGADRRTLNVRLTATGEQVQQAIERELAQCEARLAAELGEAAYAQALDAMARVQAAGEVIRNEFEHRAALSA